MKKRFKMKWNRISVNAYNSISAQLLCIGLIVATLDRHTKPNQNRIAPHIILKVGKSHVMERIVF